MRARNNARTHKMRAQQDCVHNAIAFAKRVRTKISPAKSVHRQKPTRGKVKVKVKVKVGVEVKVKVKVKVKMEVKLKWK